MLLWCFIPIYDHGITVLERFAAPKDDDDEVVKVNLKADAVAELYKI